MLTDSSRPWQLDAETPGVVPGEGAWRRHSLLEMRAAWIMARGNAHRLNAFLDRKQAGWECCFTGSSLNGVISSRKNGAASLAIASTIVKVPRSPWRSQVVGDCGVTGTSPKGPACLGRGLSPFASPPHSLAPGFGTCLVTVCAHHGVPPAPWVALDSAFVFPISLICDYSIRTQCWRASRPP